MITHARVRSRQDHDLKDLKNLSRHRVTEIGEPCIAIGKSSDIFHELDKPHIMGAVWVGAWSHESLVFAREVARREIPPSYLRSPSGNVRSFVRFAERPDFLPRWHRFYQDFASDRRRLGRIFRTVSSELLRVRKNETLKRAGDFSRLERSDGFKAGNVLKLHVDGVDISLNSVLSGAPMDILSRHVPGKFIEKKECKIFLPRTLENLDSIIYQAPNNALIISKGMKYSERWVRIKDRASSPSRNFLGMIHRRPQTSPDDKNRFLIIRAF